MIYRAARHAVLLAALLSPVAADAQAARQGVPLDSSTVARACSDIRTFFSRSDALFQQAVRSATERAIRLYADSTFADDPALHVAGSSGFSFRTKTEFLRLAADASYQPDTMFVAQTQHASVGILSATRALYVRRFVELDADYFARGRTRPYLALEAGTLVHGPSGWRVLERVNATGNSGPSDSTTAVLAWECR